MNFSDGLRLERYPYEHSTNTHAVRRGRRGGRRGPLLARADAHCLLLDMPADAIPPSREQRMPIMMAHLRIGFLVGLVVVISLVPENSTSCFEMTPCVRMMTPIFERMPGKNAFRPSHNQTTITNVKQNFFVPRGKWHMT